MQSPKNSSFSRRARRSVCNYKLRPFYTIWHLHMHHLHLFIFYQSGNNSSAVSPGHQKSSRASTGGQPYPARILRPSLSESRIPAPGPLKNPRKSQSFSEIASPLAKPRLRAMRNNTTHPDAQTAHEAKSLLECTVLPHMKEVSAV